MIGRSQPKPVAFEGSTRDDIRDFPVAARGMAGHELHQVALGEDPSRWKPMRSVGPGAREIIIETHHHGSEVQHRVVYVAKFEEAVYVLHAFEKKTQKTSKKDLDLAKQRYAGVLQERRQKK